VIRRNQEDAAEGIIDANTSARFLHEDMNNLTANLDAKFDTMATVFDTTCHTMGGLEGNIETVIGKVRAISNTMGTLEAVMHQTKAAIQTCNIRERQRDVLILRTLKAVQAQRDESVRITPISGNLSYTNTNILDHIHPGSS
jgi:hypothetical protein